MSMSGTRLSALDASFLAVESPTAHMHVGWAATFKPPTDRPAPTFAELRDHIGSRLCRGPRFRQKIALVPLGLSAPIWVDDEDFDIDNHVLPAGSSAFSEIVDESMSTPLPHDRPLWEWRIADRLEDGRIGVVGKAHHCMVDGIAAVELASLLLDPTADPPAPEPDSWNPGPVPGVVSRLARAGLDQIRTELELVRLPIRVAKSPKSLLRLADHGQQAARALASSLRPTDPIAPLNDPISPFRHLARAGRPLGDLKRIRGSFGTTVNDVVLASSAAAVRRLFELRSQHPRRLKTMVPVNVRTAGENGWPGNRISFMFVDLPCDEPDPVRRLREIHEDTSRRKAGGEAQGLGAVLDTVGYAPPPIQSVVAKAVASPRVSNLVVSNIPGPPEPMYMLGCELEEAFPVVPLADRHALSIGVTTIGDRACFGFYADSERLPEADVLGDAVNESIVELLALS
jgi:diacylglycerol O-acyltransferase